MDENKRIEDAFEKICKRKNFNIEGCKKLGQGAYGLVWEINWNGKKDAIKIIEKGKSEITGEEKLTFEIKGPNIINIKKIYNEKDTFGTGEDEQETFYNIIIMEKAESDLSKFLYKKHFSKLIYTPFNGFIGDNLLRFITNQIIKGLELFDRTDYVHLDIKPANLLTFNDLEIKLTDFSFLANVEKDKNIQKPFGTQGYITPEYYQQKEIEKNISKKQDYFALGVTLFYLIYGKKMLNYNEHDKNNYELNSDLLIDLIQSSMDQIKSNDFLDDGFIDFLCDLIQYRPEDRPSFERIYRNKWLNKNLDIESEIYDINKGDKEKLTKEFYKSDFIYPIELEVKQSKKQKKKFKFKM